MEFTMFKSLPSTMTIPTLLMVLVMVAGSGWADPTASTAAMTESVSLDFDDVPSGEIPSGWKIEATNPKGPLATWQVIEDSTAPSGAKALALTSPNHTFGGAFNLCWTPTISFLDGTIEVGFKANTGEEDQGGGVIWRAQDQDNYYIARFNPLEDNFRIYSVRDGARKTLASVRIALPAGQWHTLKIVQNGNHFEGYLNGKKLLEGTNDLFKKAGGVGLWTKADAVTSFDDFTVRPKTRGVSQ
jgi:hypothetical protein